MDRTINRLKLIFLGVFAAAAAAIGVWQVGWVQPQKACLAQRKWWDNSQRVCAQPILTSDITGRIITDKAARDEALKAIGRGPSASPPASR